MDEAPTISPQTLKCFDHITQVEILLRGDSRLINQLSIPAALNELGRFRVWTENIGAHRTGKISLDHRLRRAHSTHQRVQHLLSELNHILGELILVFSGSRLPHDEDPDWEGSDDSHDTNEVLPDTPSETEVQSLFREVSDIIDHLYDLSIAIRGAGAPRDLFRKAATINVSHFESWDIEHVRAKFPKANPILLKRLGKANSRRRQLLKYLQIHHAKFGLSADADRAAASNRNVARGSYQSESRPAYTSETKQTNAIAPTQTSADLTAPNTQTTVNTFHESGAEPLHEEVPSETTSAASEMLDVEDALVMPNLPISASEGRAFECPYCFEVMKVHTERSWRTHILRDLYPYICTFGDCAQSTRIFESRHSWFAHEAEVHRSRWLCGQCQKFLDSEADYAQHLHIAHFQKLTEKELGTMTALSSRPFERNDRATCSLCLKDNQGIRNHLARHLQALALFALPRITEDDQNDTVSRDAQVQDDEDSEEVYVISPHSSIQASSLDDDAAGAAGDDVESLGIPEGEESQLGGSSQGQGRWVDFNLRTPTNGQAPLLNAASQGQLELVQFLASEPGADVELMDNRGQTPLSRAAEVGAVQVVQFLVVSARANVNTRDSVFRRTPLNWAAGNGHAEVVRTLLAVPEVDVNSTDKYGRTPLWRAAGAGHVGVVKELLSAEGIDADLSDRYNRSPVFWAAAGNHAEVVAMIAAMPGVDVNRQDEEGTAALLRAAALGQVESLRVLLKHPDIMIELRDSNGQSALARAAEQGFIDIVTMLVDYGADINGVDSEGKTPLASAIERKHDKVAEYLVKVGAREERSGTSGHFPNLPRY